MLDSSPCWQPWQRNVKEVVFMQHGIHNLRFGEGHQESLMVMQHGIHNLRFGEGHQESLMVGHYQRLPHGGPLSKIGSAIKNASWWAVIKDCLMVGHYQRCHYQRMPHGGPLSKNGSATSATAGHRQRVMKVQLRHASLAAAAAQQSNFWLWRS